MHRFNRTHRTLLLGVAVFAMDAAPACPQEPSDVGGALERTVRRVVDRVAQSVVRLEVTRTAPPKPSAKPPLGPPRPAGVPGFPARGTPRTYFRRPDGPTTAVVVDREGGLLTSYYNVTERVQSITAVLADGRKFPATLVGADPNSDLAYLTIKATDISPIRLELQPARVGQLVVALGCHQGDTPASGPTATTGIVSATRRLRATAPEGERQGTAMQVSARLNYGNNGGPIVSMDGRLLAIAAHCTHDNTNPSARKGFNSGVGFATPTSRLRSLLPRLRAGETLKRRETPFLGVQTAGDPKGQGVRIMRLVPGAPAITSGLRVGDVIIMAGDTRVESGIDLRFAIQENDVGDRLVVVVLRGSDRARKEFTIILGARPRQPRRR